MKFLYNYICVLISSSYTIFAFSGAGSGTVESPYQITNINQLQEIQDGLSAHYQLMNDIDASETANWNDGAGFVPVGRSRESEFTGTLNGQFFSINNLYINYTTDGNEETAYGGLAGRMGVNAKISNLKITNCDVSSNSLKWYTYAGGICGDNYGGTIENCSVTGKISSNTESIKELYIGGLCASNRGPLSGSFSEVEIYAEANATVAGGLCAINHNIISDSYTKSEINVTAPAAYIGGLCGWLYSGALQRCFTACEIFADCNEMQSAAFLGVLSEGATISSCFWDTGADGGLQIDLYYDLLGMPTSMMKQRSSFESDGWDFDNTWCIIEGESYPRLQNLADGDCQYSNSVRDLTSSNEEITVFPNPTDGDLTIKVDDNDIIESIQINDPAGRCMRQIKPSAGTNIFDLNLGQLSNGLYHLKVTGRKSFYYSSFIKR